MTTLQPKESTGSNADHRHVRHRRRTRRCDQRRDVAWAIDQQPFLQGYLAVDSLWLYLNNRNTIGGGAPLSTGPAFIDDRNVDAIAEYAARGTR